MEIEKIIEIIKIAAAEVEWNYPLDYIIALNEAAELLEKQIPKKPKYISEPDVFNKAEVECECFATQDVAINTIKRVHCWKCGQLLDLSDED